VNAPAAAGGELIGPFVASHHSHAASPGSARLPPPGQEVIGKTSRQAENPFGQVMLLALKFHWSRAEIMAVITAELIPRQRADPTQQSRNMSTTLRPLAFASTVAALQATCGQSNKPSKEHGRFRRQRWRSFSVQRVYA
jgi:hypothetical protein